MLYIGRKIIFNKADGIIIKDTGQRMGLENSIKITTIEEDYPNYDPATMGHIELSFDERKAEIENMGSWKVNPITKELITYPRLTIQSDKPQIEADTIDTATITVATQDDCTVIFQVNNGTPYEVQTIDRVATFQFATDIVDTHTIKANNNLYGSNSVQVEAI